MTGCTPSHESRGAGVDVVSNAKFWVSNAITERRCSVHMAREMQEDVKLGHMNVVFILPTLCRESLPLVISIHTKVLNILDVKAVGQSQSIWSRRMQLKV